MRFDLNKYIAREAARMEPQTVEEFKADLQELAEHMDEESRMTPAQRIAADLGLSTADLERIVRDERARRLGPKMVAVIRSEAHHTQELCRMVNDFAARLGLGKKVHPEDWGEKTRAILAEIDRPVGGAT